MVFKEELALVALRRVGGQWHPLENTISPSLLRDQSASFPEKKVLSCARRKLFLALISYSRSASRINTLKCGVRLVLTRFFISCHYQAF